MDPDQRAFYRFHAALMEPWDGPASVAFTDGTVIGAVLDRNGLRPSRYWVTDDDLVIMASEVGVLDIDPAKVVSKGRLQPGRMFLIDTREGRIVDDEEIKTTLAAEHPYGEWLDDGIVQLPDLPGARARRVQPRQRAAPPADVRLHPRGAEDHRRADGARPVPSRSGRWAPTRRSPCCRAGRGCCSTTSSSCSRRSPTRRSTPSARRSSRRSASTIGPEANLLVPGPDSCRQLALPFPIIDNDELAKIIHANDDGAVPRPRRRTSSAGLYRVAGGGPRAARRARRDLRRGVAGRSTQRRRGSSCSPTATPTRSTRRSRRCC